MKKLIFVIYLILTHVFAQPITILPFGNSITNGAPDSYRYMLWKTLVQMECDVDLIGDRNYHGRPSGTPNVMGLQFDENHAGFPGRTTGQAISDMSGILSAVGNVDIALIHLGTNDIAENVPLSAVISNMYMIVDTLQAANPGMHILLSQIIPMLNSPIDNDSIIALNDLYADLADANQDVWLVNMYENFEEERNYNLPNQIHPSKKGANVMASRWAAVLAEILPCMGRCVYGEGCD